MNTLRYMYIELTLEHNEYLFLNCIFLCCSLKISLQISYSKSCTHKRLMIANWSHWFYVQLIDACVRKLAHHWLKHWPVACWAQRDYESMLAFCLLEPNVSQILIKHVTSNSRQCYWKCPLQNDGPFSLGLHDDVIKWNYFPLYWSFVRGIHRSSVNSPHKGQWRGALMFSLICVWINGWVNNRESGDLRRYRAHYDVIVMNVLAN